MTAAEIERAFSQMQAQVSAQQAVITGLEEKLGEAEDKWIILFSTLMEPPLGDKNGPSFYSRMVRVVVANENLYRLGRWLGWLFFMIPTVGGVLGVYMGWIKVLGQ